MPQPGNKRGELRVWDLIYSCLIEPESKPTEGWVAHEVEGRRSGVTCAKYRTCGKRVFSAGEDGVVGTRRRAAFSWLLASRLHLPVRMEWWVQSTEERLLGCLVETAFAGEDGLVITKHRAAFSWLLGLRLHCRRAGSRGYEA